MIKQVIVLLTVCLIGCSENDLKVTPKERLDLFIKSSMPESSLIPFLVDGGEEMVPILITEAKNKESVKRRYIISAIGELKSKQSLDPLVTIVFDSSEEVYFRCDALEAIDKIDPNYLSRKNLKAGVISLTADCTEY